MHDLDNMIKIIIIYCLGIDIEDYVRFDLEFYKSIMPLTL